LLGLVRSFPAWTDAEKALASVGKNGPLVMKSFDAARAPFRDWAGREPDAIASVLLRLDDQICRWKPTIQAHIDVMASVRQEFNRVKTLNGDIKRRRAETKAAEAAAEKSEKEVTSATRKLEVERARGGTAEARAEAKLNTSVQQRDATLETKNTRTEQLADDEFAYKEGLCEVVFDLVRIIKDGRTPCAEQFVEIGREIIEIAAWLPEREDPPLDDLKAEIAALDTEWTEVDEAAI